MNNSFLVRNEIMRALKGGTLRVNCRFPPIFSYTVWQKGIIKSRSEHVFEYVFFKDDGRNQINYKNFNNNNNNNNFFIEGT